jgi:hypothetical protein
MAVLGLIIIAIGWITQAMRAKKGTFAPEFGLLYILGVFLLVLDGISAGLYTLALLNAVTLGLALMTLILLTKQGTRKATGKKG